MKIQLEAELTRLLTDLKNLATEDPQNPGHFIASYEESGGNSEDDNSAEITSYTDDLSLVEDLERELRDVRKSLESIEKKTYGICKYCKKEIDSKRLEARPTSSACITCKKTLTQEI